MVNRGAQIHIALLYEENKSKNQQAATGIAMQVSQSNRVTMSAQPNEM